MASFRKQFVSGVFYTSLAKYSGIIIHLIITAVLARILKPEDFGVIALATVFILFFNTLTEAGIGPAIIQKKEFQKKDYDALFFITALIGLFFSVIFYIISPLIGLYYDNYTLTAVCKWLSILILFSSLDIVPNNILILQKRFNVIAYRTVTVQIVCGIASIYAAYIGWGVYALLLSAVLSKVLVFFVNYLRNPLKFSFDFSCLNGIKSYSTYQFLSNLLRYMVRNIDKMIIGKMLGMYMLGFYEKSYRLMMLPLQNITFVVTPVLQPLFSDYQNDFISMGNKYLKLLNYMAYISFPLTALLFFTARELILIVFGDQWEPSVLPFRILAISVEIQVLQSTVGAMFQSANYTKGLFGGGCISFVIYAVGLIMACACFGTISAVAVSFVITNFIGVALVFYILFTRIGLPLSSFLKQLLRPALLMLILFAIMAAYCYFVNIDNVIISLIVKSSIIFAITLFLFLKWNIIPIDYFLLKLECISKRFCHLYIFILVVFLFSCDREGISTMETAYIDSASVKCQYFVDLGEPKGLQDKDVFENNIYQFYNNGVCKVFDCETKELIKTLQAPKDGHYGSVAFSPIYETASDDLPLLYVGGPFEGKVNDGYVVINLNSGGKICRI